MIIRKRDGWKRRRDRYLADIAAGDVGGGPAEESHPLVLPGELVGRVHLLIAPLAQRRLVSAAQHRRLRPLTHVALHLHLSLPLPSSLAAAHEQHQTRLKSRSTEDKLSFSSPVQICSSSAPHRSSKITHPEALTADPRPEFRPFLASPPPPPSSAFRSRPLPPSRTAAGMLRPRPSAFYTQATTTPREKSDLDISTPSRPAPPPPPASRDPQD